VDNFAKDKSKRQEQKTRAKDKSKRQEQKTRAKDPFEVV
jgi:hypothetical protein